jgi:predicted nucleic acid-binding protein
MRAYLDANFFIAYVESDAVELQSLVARAVSGGWDLVTSEFTLAEILVMPIRTANTALIEIYDELLGSSDVFEIAPVTRSILRGCAAIRATIGNKTPDSIHVATALDRNCTVFLSSDQRIKLPPTILRVPLERANQLDVSP